MTPTITGSTTGRGSRRYSKIDSRPDRQSFQSPALKRLEAVELFRVTPQRESLFHGNQPVQQGASMGGPEAPGLKSNFHFQTKTCTAVSLVYAMRPSMPPSAPIPDSLCPAKAITPSAGPPTGLPVALTTTQPALTRCVTRCARARSFVHRIADRP